MGKAGNREQRCRSLISKENRKTYKINPSDPIYSANPSKTPEESGVGKRQREMGTTVFGAFDIGRCDMGDLPVFGCEDLVCNERGGLII